MADRRWLTVMGDFNSKIGFPMTNEDDVMEKFGFGERNKNGERLITFARSRQLFITNTMFKSRPSRRFTWCLGRAKNEIDFILVRRNQRGLVQNVKVLNRFRFETDHRFVRMVIKLELKPVRIRMIYQPRIFIVNEYNNNKL